MTPETEKRVLIASGFVMLALAWLSFAAALYTGGMIE